ncbi:hypothetical protein AVEN_205502-1 [Araneus ventricosus]|uniref:Uncharacterized protein n=1 Tax=Araneus ventricosus TaxID=182803 RepID=A0A4Y2EXF1_ARAVE|nr:hypothetical protein AVEN_6388-1 [Araneus ventricosus]GBM32391.1 hypothetical protein AVEN_259928-1 [Araneus ventricosus]GBM32559.1 hypothetical protein AVEN_205150-1 [Araneus ventricosus]GBM32564.1 hypothetical protein AVEN_205502-1 [Araneus ventricosus]
MAKFLICGDLYDLIPLTIFGYLLVLLKRDIDKEKLDAVRAIKDDLQENANVFSQTEPYEFSEKSTQTLEKKECSYLDSGDRSTQTVVEKNEVYIQVEGSQFKITSTEIVKEIEHDKSVQVVLQTSEDKETQTTPYFCLEKEVQTENIQNSSKVFVPVKKQKPKPTIPQTKEFLKYHQNKHMLHRKKNSNSSPN